MEVKMFFIVLETPRDPKARGWPIPREARGQCEPRLLAELGLLLEGPQAPGGNQARLSHCSPSSCEPLVIPWGLVPAWLCHSQGATKPQLWEGWSSSRSIFYVSLPCCHHHHQFLGVDSLPCPVPLCCSPCLLCTLSAGVYGCK